MASTVSSQMTLGPSGVFALWRFPTEVVDDALGQCPSQFRGRGIAHPFLNFADDRPDISGSLRAICVHDPLACIL